MKIQIMPSCSNGSKLLTEREFKMLVSYSRLMEKMCHEYWPVEYAEFKELIKGKRWSSVSQFKDVGSIDRNTMWLIFMLATDIELRDATQERKRFPSRGKFGSPGRLIDSPRWHLPSPFYACRHIRKKMCGFKDSKQQVCPSGELIAKGKGGWIARRKAEVKVFTLHHEDIPVGPDSGPRSSVRHLKRSMQRLQARFDSIRDLVAEEWLVGGYAGWDVAPKKNRGGERVLNLHLHILGEPYGKNGEVFDSVPSKVAAAWASSKKRKTEVIKASQGPRWAQHSDDTLVQLLYVAGVARVGSEEDYCFYPKFIRGFDKEQVGKKGYKTSEKPQRPSMRQLHMIHGLYMAQHDDMLGFFGGWKHSTRVGIAIRDIDGKRLSQMRQNDPTLRELI